MRVISQYIYMYTILYTLEYFRQLPSKNIKKAVGNGSDHWGGCHSIE